MTVFNRHQSPIVLTRPKNKARDKFWMSLTRSTWRCNIMKLKHSVMSRGRPRQRLVSPQKKKMKRENSLGCRLKKSKVKFSRFSHLLLALKTLLSVSRGKMSRAWLWHDAARFLFGTFSFISFLYFRRENGSTCGWKNFLFTVSLDLVSRFHQKCSANARSRP